MLPKCARVIKSNAMEINGAAHIEPAAGTVAPSGIASAAGQQVRIIESNESHAILELTCACGCKSRVQCDYEAA